MIPFVVTSILGCRSGAFVLIKPPLQTFLHVLPWLMLGATLLFALGKHLTGRISAGISHDATNAAVAGASFFELLVAVYGGGFFPGGRVMNLAAVSPRGVTHNLPPKKIKTILSGGIN